jgi:DNA replication and repair protein RecF
VSSADHLDMEVEQSSGGLSLALIELSMTDFRLFDQVTVEPATEGTTVLSGPNGSGKTTILEAVAFLGSQRSFRGAPKEAMIQGGRVAGYVRGEFLDAERKVTVETELTRGSGESRAQVNRQRARRADLAAAVPVTVFSPEDLSVVQGGPSARRGLLDDALALLDRRSATAVEDTERALRQRGALLRQSGGRKTPEIEATLDVWDERLAKAAELVVGARQILLAELGPLTSQAYGELADSPAAVDVQLRYEQSWEGPYAVALSQRRQEDLRRGATTAGPNRDDVAVQLNGRDSRVQASQGEQRCLALALRLGIHHLLTERLGRPPILLLDDVFSELDPGRSRALVRQLPWGQSLLSTAVPLPEGMEVAMVIDVENLRS